MAVWSAIRLSELAIGLRLDPEYYQPSNLADAQRLAATSPAAIGSFAVVTDGIHASPDEVEDGGVRYLSAKCVKNNFFALGDALRISEAQHSANPRTSLREFDVLVTTVGTIGNAAVVQADILPANADRHLGIVRIKPDSNIDPYYLSAFLNSKFGRFQTLREATGNVQLNLFIEKIRELLVPSLPCADEVSRLTRKAYQRRRQSVELIEVAETRLTRAIGLDHLDLEPQRSYASTFRELQAGNRIGAEYFMPCKKRALDALLALPHKRLADHAPSARELWNPVRVSPEDEVRNFDITHALEPFLDDTNEAQRVSEVRSTKKRLRAGDVVISRLRSYLKEIAVVRTSDALPVVGSSEFIVLRPTGEGLSAATLMVFLRSRIVQTILKWSQDGSNHPRFAEKDLLAIPVPNALLKAQRKIDDLVDEAIAARTESVRLILKATAIIEAAVEDQNIRQSR